MLFSRKPKQEDTSAYNFPVPLTSAEKDQRLLQGFADASSVIKRTARELGISAERMFLEFNDPNNRLQKLKSYRDGKAIYTLPIPKADGSRITVEVLVTGPKDGVILAKNTKSENETRSVLIATLGKDIQRDRDIWRLVEKITGEASRPASVTPAQHILNVLAAK